MPTSDFRELTMDKVTQCCTVTIMHSDVHNTNNRSKHTYNSTCCQAPYFSVIIDQLLHLSVFSVHKIVHGCVKTVQPHDGPQEPQKCCACIFIIHCSNFIPSILTSKFFEANLVKDAFLLIVFLKHLFECHVIKLLPVLRILWLSKSVHNEIKKKGVLVLLVRIQGSYCSV